jgi:L,D-transpeptidase catalytic domain
MMLKKKSLKNAYLFFSSLIIAILHLPLLSGKGKPDTAFNSADTWLKRTAAFFDTLLLPVTITLDASAALYDSLKLQAAGLTRQAFDLGLKGFGKLKEAGQLANEELLTIVDFSQPSASKRLYVIDLDNKQVLFHTWVAHGKNSGEAMATVFSNAPESNKSSLGFYITGTTYQGRNGYSLRLNGQERGINDNAARRDIVIHGATYVNTQYIESQGWIGRSQGCPALAPEINRPVIETIKEGSCLFIYAPQENYLQVSTYIR